MNERFAAMKLRTENLRLLADVGGTTCVAVLYSPGYGAGWSTWNSDKSVIDGSDTVFCPELAKAVVIAQGREDYAEVLATAAQHFPQAYPGGVSDLVVQWVPVGAQFVIDEYDGSESVQLREKTDWHTA